MRQRCVLGVGIVLAGMAYLLAGRSLTAADLSFTGSLLFAASPAKAIALAAGASALAVLLGLLASATGNALAGPFLVGAALLFAAAGAAVDPWMRHSNIPPAYWTFVFETGLWMVLVMAIIAAVRFARDGLRERLPAALRADHFDGAWPERLPSLQMQAGSAGLIVVVAVIASVLLQTSSWKAFSAALIVALVLQGMLWALAVVIMRATNGPDTPKPAAMLGGFVATAVSATVMLLMIRSMDVGQVIAAIALGSLFGSLAAAQLCPATPIAMILLAPLTVAVGAYATVAVSYSDGPAVLRAAWHTLNATPGTRYDHMLSLALAMPIHYAAAGLTGAAMGLGWAQALFAARLKPQAEVATA